ncbi:hypothetical protein [Nocardia nova]|uniref:hypothetical protein n=1 Tax=Nocardia nova TaxID=37330 RepID=UPI00215822E0|nr:hypothetical protein [Nocardia nova]
MIARAGTPVWIRILRIAFGVLGIVALLWIPLRAGQSPGFSIGNYVSYFTIESNIAGVLVLLIGGLLDPARRWQVVRGAAAGLGGACRRVADLPDRLLRLQRDPR